MAAARKVSQAASRAVWPRWLDEVRQFGGGGGLAGAVDADNRNHSGAARRLGAAPIDRLEKLFAISRARDLENIQLRAALVLISGLYRLNDLAGHFHAEIRGD